MVGQRQPYCVDRLVAVKALAHQAHEGASDRDFVAERDLIFDDRVEYGVRLYVRQPDAGSPVIVLRQPDALALVQRQPLSRLGRLEGIVASHVEPFGRWSRKGNWIARDRTQATERLLAPVNLSERDFVR